MSGPSLEGRIFRDVTEHHLGEVDSDTLFAYHQDDDGVVWARYAGGAVRLGYLVGTRSGDQLDFRYAHVTTRGETASGHCRTSIEVLDDGRIRLHESWEWDSRTGGGTSIVEEFPRGRAQQP
jgi:hypothetical protein